VHQEGSWSTAPGYLAPDSHIGNGRSVVLIYRTFRYRIYPTADQAARLRSWGDALRFLWNLAHEQRLLGISRQRSERRFYSAFAQQKDLTALRAELPWLADVPRNVSAQLLAELDKAWQRWSLKLSAKPRFKRRGNEPVGICEPHQALWSLDTRSLRFPKLGTLRAVAHRPTQGTPKTCSIKRDGDQWFASIVCEIEVKDPPARHEPVVAIDRGVINVVADSDGNIVKSPRFYERAMKRLAYAQRVVARRKKGSKNREKAKARVMRIHRKVRRQREHFIHELSTNYAKSHGTVVVEDLRTANMARVGGRLARGIFGAGWGLLTAFLTYKLAPTGGRVISVPAAYSSQTCACCGVVDVISRHSQSLFHCTACGMLAHADLNAALVLKSRANRSALPVEGSALATRRSRKRLRVPKRATEVSDVVAA
jgi:putative transposase